MSKTSSRRGSTTKMKEPNDDEVWTCKLCKTKFTDEKAEVLECEYCDGHFCRNCVKLSQAEYKLLSKRKDFHWYCPPCEEKAMRNIKIEKEIEERCRDYFEKYEERLNDLEKEIANKPDTESVKKMIEESKSNTASGTDVNANLNEINDKLEEYKESVQRRSNIVIFNATESDDIVAEKRKENDMAIMQELCHLTGTNVESIKNVTRLGRKPTERSKPRPMRVIFEDEKSKGKLMSNLKNLNRADENLRKLSITHDLTQKEREQNKLKWEEAKEKNSNLQSGDENFKFIVKGPPWDRKVVKIKKH